MDKKTTKNKNLSLGVAQTAADMLHCGFFYTTKCRKVAFSNPPKNLLHNTWLLPCSGTTACTAQLHSWWFNFKVKRNVESRNGLHFTLL